MSSKTYLRSYLAECKFTSEERKTLLSGGIVEYFDGDENDRCNISNTITQYCVEDDQLLERHCGTCLGCFFTNWQET